jgi:hypothetical protein
MNYNKMTFGQFNEFDRIFHCYIRIIIFIYTVLYKGRRKSTCQESKTSAGLLNNEHVIDSKFEVNKND